MQLGARWRVGDPPHRSVPKTLHATIAAQELAHPAADSWTLTWLEGRPRCELGDAVIVTLDAAGACVVLPGGAGIAATEDDDDDWLS